MTHPDDALITSRELRDKNAGRVDVLDKVKALAMLPGDTYVTTEMVAAYFEVGVDAIRSAVHDNRDEVESDGYRVATGAELNSFKEFGVVGARASSLALFPRRAVLRLGMLLRDSPVARGLRDHLLDAEQSLPDLSTSDGQIVLLSRMLEIAKRNKALELANATQAKELESARPQTDYVKRHVDAIQDVFTVDTVANQLGVTEPAFRAYLVGHDIIRRRHVGNRWSKKQQRRVPEYEWLARGKYRTWFTSKDQPEAPRLHNGQMRTTLYFNAVGKQRIRQFVDRYPISAPLSLDDEAA